MSWINNRQHPGGQPMPPANNSPATATTLPQSSSVGFGGGVGGGSGQQQQQQVWQQQPLHSYNQPPQQYSPHHNNLYNANPTLNPTSRNISQQSWQQNQSLSNQYFNKQNPVVDSYATQNLMTAPPSSQPAPPPPQHYQQQNQNIYYSQNTGTNNTSVTNALNQHLFIKSEVPTTDTMASALQQSDTQHKTEGWDDWDWNDNNQSLQKNVQNQHPNNQHNSQNFTNQNVIVDSFSTDQTDNWNWNTDDAKNSNILQQPSELTQNQFISQEKQLLMNNSGQTAIGIGSGQNLDASVQPVRPSSLGSPSAEHVQNVMPPPQFSAQQDQQTLQQPQSINQQPPLINQKIATSVPLPPPSIPQPITAGQQSQSIPMPQPQSINQQPALINQQIATSVPLSTPSTQQPLVAVQQSQPTPVQSNYSSEGSSNPASNNVYVSQAKPVSQPARQFAMTPSLTGQATSINTVNSDAETSQTPPQASSSSLPPPPVNQTPPPPPLTTASGSNPYKRAGAAQHHRVALAPVANLQPSVMQPHFVGPVVGDFQQVQQNAGGNQECLAPDNSEVIVDNKNYEVENQEIAPSNDRSQYQEGTPSNDRNQYLQTDHLSEERYNNIEMAQETNEQDRFPPPGLSRLVLGQPETDNPQSNTASQNDIPPGLDRMVPGTELAGINMERQADGQDTIPAPRSVFSNVSAEPADNILTNIDIIDRNLYLVAGESDVHEQRIVTGLENESSQGTAEHREVEMDGENLEDQQQQQLQHHHHHQHHEQHFEDDIEITREEPIEGANTLDSLPSPTAHHETESSLTLETNQKDLSNPSTCNDDSDHKGRHSSYYGKSNSRKQDEKRRLPSATDSKQRKERYDTESDYYSSDRDRKFREGSVRNDRERDKKSKDRDHRDRREGSTRDQDRYRDDKDERDGRRYERDRHRGKHERDLERDRNRDRERGSRYNNSRYETDSKYETESSIRYERRRGEKERDRDRDRDRQDYDYRREDKEKRHRRGGDRHERDDRDRRRDNERDYRDRRRGDTRGERGRGGGSSNEFDEDSYSRRAVSSRNTRDTDRDYKDRSMRDMKDPRYPANMYGHPSGYGYDPYSYYQHQQYYEQLRRTNPQLYAEWYRKYYGQMQTDLIANDGRESVHSGRSSANNDKDRYSYQHQYFQHSNEYQQQQRHFLHPPSIGSSLNSTTIGERSFNLNGGPSTGNLSQYNLQQLQQQQQMAGVGYPSASTARSYYSQNDYLETRSDQLNASLNVIDGASTTQEPQRLTPCKFTNDHSIAQLANGLMVCVKPKYAPNGVTNIVKIWKFVANDGTKRLFNSFPGPLVRGITHKKTIIEFCEDQIRLGPPSIMLRSRNNSVSSICSMGNVNRGSFTLMWNLLILLLRQNGMVVGTDIAELLMKNKNQFPFESNQPNHNAVKSGSASRRDSIQSDQKKSHESHNTPSDDDNEDSIKSKDDDSDELDSKKSLSEEEITEKFRNYLLYGNVNEALEWAADNNLWGHALFLASKVDRRLHANVMMKFANKLSLNDPLQTLYQLMSGRTPSSVTSVQDEKWGDWRPHLAMILSNTSPRPDLDRKAITTLGDSLYNRGDLFGAQFCYLMAQVGFGRYSSVNQESTLMSNSANAIRLILLGSSHHKTFREFATNEAIIMTEIYEYACALNDEKFSIVEFQPYKYLLGLRMLDYGMQLKTLMYMEQISRHIQLEPSKYEASFIEKVYTLSERLKFVDPMREKSMDDQEGAELNQLEDQPWLQSLREILNDSNINATQQINELPSRSQIDQQFTEINQQISALSIQYDNFESGIDQQKQQQQQQQLQHQQSYPGAQLQNDANFQIQYQQQTVNSGIDATLQPTDQYGNFYNPNNQQQMPSLSGQENATSDYDSYGPQSYDQQPNYAQDQYQHIPPTHNQQEGDYAHWNQQNQQEVPSGQNTTDQVSATPTPPQLPTPSSVHEATSTLSSSIATTSTPNNLTTYSRATKTPVFTKQAVSLSTSGTDQKPFEPKRSPHKLPNNDNKKVAGVPIGDHNRSTLSPPATTPSKFLPNNNVNCDPSPESIEDTPRPQISMPNSVSNKAGYFDDSANEKNAVASSGQSNENANATSDKKTSAKVEGKKSNSNNNNAANSGWFGGIWNKLSLKPKNQMILPDDKNPAIVWDPDKKRWVNTDGDENVNESFKPPPKMADIVQTAYNANIARLPNAGNGVEVSSQIMQPPQFQLQQQQQQIQPQQMPQQMSYDQQDVPMMSTMSNISQPSTSPGLISSATTTNSMSASGNPSATSGTAGDQAKKPSLQSNMFKMQRNRTLKKSYVDVFNPSGAPTKPIEPVLAPMMPTTAVPKTGIFVPAPVPNDDNGPQQQQPQEGMPQFYNPNQFSYQQQ